MAEITPTTENRRLVEATSGVLLINDDEQVPAESYSYTVALSIAASSGVPITLYDRTEETWGDSQHPEGPLASGDARLEDRPKLTDQIAWFNDHEVIAQGWVSTLPSISAVLTALAHVSADVVIVPDDVGRKFLERALEGGSLAETLAEQISRNPDVDAVVLQVDTNGIARPIAS